MATNYPTNENRTNYARLCRAIIDLSTDVLRDLLESQLLPADILTELRKIPETSKVIKCGQWGFIKDAYSLGTYKKFDISLLTLILRILSVRDVANILQKSIPLQTLQTSVQHCPALMTDPKTKLSQQELKDLQNIKTTKSYSNGKDKLLWKLYTVLCTTTNQNLVHPSVAWGSTEMPDPAHTTVGDDIERLRHIRNQAYGHVPSSEIPIKEYNTFWDVLEKVMTRMDTVITGRHYKAALDRIKNVCMDADLEKKYLDNIKTLSEAEKIMEEEIKAIQNEFAGMKEDVMRMKKYVSEIKDDVIEINEQVLRIEIDFPKVKDDVAEIKEDIMETKGDFSQIKETISYIQEDVTCIKEDIPQIKDDILGIKENVLEFKEEVLGIRVHSQRVQDSTTQEIERHKRDSTFVITSAVSKGIDILDEHGILTYIGPPGQGKTKNALEVMKQLQISHPNWKFIEIDNAREWSRLIDSNIPSVVLLNDMIGKTNIDDDLVNDGDRIFAQILSSVEVGKVKVIMTIRNILLDKNITKLEKYKLFDLTYIVDLSSEEFQLDEDTKKTILLRHCENNGIEITNVGNFSGVDMNDQTLVVKLEESVINVIVKTDPVIGFPLACYLFCCKRKYTQLGAKFFNKPTQHILDEISSLINSEASSIEKVQYCLMVYMLLKNGKLDGKIDEEMFNRITQSVKLQELPTKRDRKEGIEKLLNRYILRDFNSGYVFKHQTIFESVAVCFCNDDPDLLLELCTKEFIQDFVRPQTFQETAGEVVCKIGREVYNTVSKRFLCCFESDQNQTESYNWWICHPLLKDNLFVDYLIKTIETRENDQKFNMLFRSKVVGFFYHVCRSGTTYFLKKVYTRLTSADVEKITCEFEKNKFPFKNDCFPIHNLVWLLDHDLLGDNAIGAHMGTPNVSLINHSRVSLEHVIKHIRKLCSSCDESIIKAIFRRWSALEYCHVLKMFNSIILFDRPVSCMSALIECRPDIVSDKTMKKVFSIACAKNNTEMTKYLLNFKHDNLENQTIHITDNHENLTNLHIAAFYGSFDVCKKLVELGLQNDRTVHGVSVLQMAILGYCFRSYGIHEAVKVIKHLSSAILFVILALSNYIPNQLEILKYAQLIEFIWKTLTVEVSDFDLAVDIHGSKLVHYCVFQDDLTLIELIYNINKTSIHVTNNDNMSGIHIAALFGRLKIFMKMVEFGVSISGKTSTKSLSVLQLAMKGLSKESDNYPLPLVLVKRSEDENSHTKCTSYDYCTSNFKCYEKIILFLLQHETFLETDLDMALDKFGSSFIHYFVLFDNLSLIEMLYTINKSLVNDTNNDGMSGIHIAAFFGRSEIFMKLLEFGVRISGKTTSSDLSVMQLAVIGFVHTDVFDIYSSVFFKQLFLKSPVIEHYKQSLFLDQLSIKSKSFEQIITFLLEHGEYTLSDLEMKVDIFGNSFIPYCIVNNSLPIIKLLCKNHPELLSVEIVNKNKAYTDAQNNYKIKFNPLPFSTPLNIKRLPLALSVILGRSDISKYLLSGTDVSNEEINNLIQLVYEGKQLLDYGFSTLSPNISDYLYFVSERWFSPALGTKFEFKTIYKTLQKQASMC